MALLTRAQREALAAVYHRHVIYPSLRYGTVAQDSQYETLAQDNGVLPLTYREFRKRVRYASYDPCIMIQWCGMWLGIEPDGYTHS